MIEGVPLDKIEHTDYYRRFIVLKMLLQRMKVKSELEEMESTRKYGQILQDLEELQRMVAIKNSSTYEKVCDTLLRIDELQSQLAHSIPKVTEKKDALEGDLLKRWRDSLIQKKKNEEETRKQKDAKSTSNKNLMYLTSELMKKERVSHHNLVNHKQKIEQIHQKMEALIQQGTLQFGQKHKRLKQMINEEKDRVEAMIKQYRESLQEEQAQFIAKSRQQIGHLQQKLRADHVSFVANAKGLKQILTKLRAKRQLH